MKRELIRKLYKEFEKDKETIRENLITAMYEIMLETSDKYGKITMIIKYERG